MRRRIGYLSLLLALVCSLAGALVGGAGFDVLTNAVVADLSVPMTEVLCERG